MMVLSATMSWSFNELLSLIQAKKHTKKTNKKKTKTNKQKNQNKSKHQNKTLL
jgi:hypothetical protein